MFYNTHVAYTMRYYATFHRQLVINFSLKIKRMERVLIILAFRFDFYDESIVFFFLPNVDVAAVEVVEHRTTPLKNTTTSQQYKVTRLRNDVRFFDRTPGSFCTDRKSVIRTVGPYDKNIKLKCYIVIAYSYSNS